MGDDPFFPVAVDLFNNDFDQSTSGTYIKIPFAIDPSNLDSEDPLFVSSDNSHLTPSSPCINTGNNDAPSLPDKDKDDNPRIVDGTVDMGAYEYNSSAPIADAGADQTVVAGENVLLDGSNSSDPGGEPLTYLWTQIAGPIVTLSDAATVQPTFTAPDVGLDGESLTFQLIVTDTSDLRNTDSVTVNVNAAEPVAHFVAAPRNGTVPLTVNFTDESTGSITSWEWTFGDGGTSTQENPSYTYETPGIYTVSLTVAGPVGSDTETKSDYITATSSFYGSLTVTIIPQEAIDAGARWNVDGGEWQESGTTASELSIGIHTVSYKDVIGWDPPSSEFVTIKDGQTTELTGNYTKTLYSPSVATGSASDISFTSARLNATVNPNGTETTVLFEYGTGTDYGSVTPETNAGSGSEYVALSAALYGLTPNTTYHFRVKATNSGGTSYGDDRSFTTMSEDTVYVEPEAVCGGKSPCFATIGEGVSFVADGGTVNVAQGSFHEDIALDEPKEVFFLGGWDSTFTSRISYTTATGLVIRQGTIVTYNLVLKPLIETSSEGPAR
ncbi:MAG: PKD domain-containing protein [Deltaproteobacteria bacterium]|nr:PKD domain-containing protein [Deltaproteobacteria bacterium]